MISQAELQDNYFSDNLKLPRDEEMKSTLESQQNFNDEKHRTPASPRFGKIQKKKVNIAHPSFYNKRTKPRFYRLFPYLDNSTYSLGLKFNDQS